MEQITALCLQLRLYFDRIIWKCNWCVVRW